MKRHLLCLLLALCLLPVSALANSWGAPGGTVAMFSNNHAYDDYTSTADDYSRSADDVRLIMHNRYHNQLICGSKVGGEWGLTTTSTKAVWQPDDGKDEGKWPELERTADGFTLLYEDESYRFGGADLILLEADLGGLTFTYQENAYLVRDAGGSVSWPLYGGLRLEDFNIRRCPAPSLMQPPWRACTTRRWTGAISFLSKAATAANRPSTARPATRAGAPPTARPP